MANDQFQRPLDQLTELGVAEENLAIEGILRLLGNDDLAAIGHFGSDLGGAIGDRHQPIVMGGHPQLRNEIGPGPVGSP